MIQPLNTATIGFMSTLEEIEAAVQQLSPSKRAEFRAWFLSFDASEWDQQIEDDLTSGKLDWLAIEAISEGQAGGCSDLRHHASSRFWTCYQLLPSEIKPQADLCIKLSEIQPRHSLFHFKKISKFWSASVDLRLPTLALKVVGMT
jgi:hypothetical protein